MKRKMYRIELNEADSIFTDCVIMASLSNGNTGYIPLDKIADAADALCEKYPTNGETHTVNRIGEHDLTIDKGLKNIIHLTEITVMDLTEELCPTLSRYDSETILKEIEQPNSDQN